MKKSGFTLTELLVTISIITVILTIALSSYNTTTKQSRDTKRKNDLEQIRAALEMYKTDYGYYPAVNTGGFDVASNLTSSLTTTYVAVIPSDPLSSQGYLYVALNPVNSQYYGYCLCAQLETQSASNSCTVSVPSNCSYGVRNP